MAFGTFCLDADGRGMAILYALTRQDQLQKIADTVGNVTKDRPFCAPGVLKAAVGAVENPPNSLEGKDLPRLEVWRGRRDSNPQPPDRQCQKTRIPQVA